MAEIRAKNKLFIQVLRKVTACDYALRFGGTKEHWQELYQVLCDEQRNGYGVVWDPYALDDKGAWVIEASVLANLTQDYFGRDALLQHQRIADARYEREQSHAG